MPQPERQPEIFPPGTPRFYQECKLISSGEAAPLRFQSSLINEPFGGVSHLVFLASLHRSPTCPAENVVVKLASKYGQDVHQFLESQLLAPKLIATSSMEGIPTAYVMERLSSQWVTLHDLAEDNTIDFNRRSGDIHTSLMHIVELLRGKGYVHGDLRANNIMINTNTLQGEGQPDIKIVDFNWSGKAGVTRYPGTRNESIKFPGKPGHRIQQGDDAKLLEIWWPEILASVERKLLSA
ncbi:hypothetical protein H1R20_g12811, partial [Candolleomyces eurysporus]